MHLHEQLLSCESGDEVQLYDQPAPADIDTRNSVKNAASAIYILTKLIIYIALQTFDAFKLIYQNVDEQFKPRLHSKTKMKEKKL